MDVKKMIKVTKRKAAALTKKLEGTGSEVEVLTEYCCYNLAYTCPVIRITCDGGLCSKMYSIVAAACTARNRWTMTDVYLVPGMYRITIAIAEADALHRADSAIGHAVFEAGWTVNHDARVKNHGIPEAGWVAVKRLYGTDDMTAVAAAYIARLDAAETVEDVASIKNAVIDEINALKAAYDAAEAEAAAPAAVEPAAVEPVAASSEAVELAETAKYTLDNDVEYMYRARVRGVEVGSASVIVYDDGDAYVERIDVDDGYRNRGYGTAMLKQLAAMYGDVYVAPDNDDARRLYARLGDDVTGKGSWGYVDQGYGVYAIAA